MHHCGHAQFQSIAAKAGHVPAHAANMHSLKQQRPWQGTQALNVYIEACCAVDELQQLLAAEKANGQHPDWHLDAFMKAGVLEHQPEAIATEYIMRILGLDVCPCLLVKTEPCSPC